MKRSSRSGRIVSPNKRYFYTFLACLILAFQTVGCDVSLPSASGLTEMDSPVGSNSRSPRLSQTTEGNPLLSWVEMGEDAAILKFSTFEQGRWSAAQEVARGDDWVVNGADTPSVVQVSDSVFAAHWLVENPASAFAYNVLTSFSLDRGETWSKTIMPHSDGTATEHGFVNLYNTGATDSYGIVWLDGRNSDMNPSSASAHAGGGVALYSAVVRLDGSISAEEPVDQLACDCCPTSVAQGPLGPIVAYRNRDESEQRDIFYSRLINGKWSTPASVGFDDWHITGCPVNGPAIASYADVVAVAWFTAAGGRKRIRLAISHDGGQVFEEPFEVAHGNVQGRVGVVLDASNQVTVSWLSVPTNGELAEIQLRTYSLVEKNLQQINQTSKTIASSKAQGLPVIALGPEGSVILAWTDGSIRSPKVKVFEWLP